MKVQAQRKFAQASSYGSSARFSQTASSSTKNNKTPKEKDKNLSSSGVNSPIAVSEESKDAFPGCCPKAEDFLAFLCFRGSSILPPMEALGLVPRLQIKDSKGEDPVVKTPQENPPLNTSATKPLEPEPKSVEDNLKKESLSTTTEAPSTAKEKLTTTNSISKAQHINPRRFRYSLPRAHSAFASRMLTRLSTRVLGWNMAQYKRRSRRAVQLRTLKSEKKKEAPVASTVCQKQKRPSPKSRVSSVEELSEKKEDQEAGITTRKGTQLKPPPSLDSELTVKAKSSKTEARRPRLRRRLSRKTKEVAAVCLSLLGDDEEEDEEQEQEAIESDSSSSEEETQMPRPTRRSTLLQRIACRSAPVTTVKKRSDKSMTEQKLDVKDKRKASSHSVGVKTRRAADKDEFTEKDVPSTPVTRSKSCQSVFRAREIGKKAPELAQLRDKLIQAAKKTLLSSLDVPKEESKRETRTAKKRSLERNDSAEGISSKTKKLTEYKAKESTPVAPKPSTGLSSLVTPLETSSAPSTYNCKDIREAKVFKPSEAEWADPLTYLQSVRAEAEPYGICRIVPPSNFRPECNLQEDLRFTGYRHYIHRMWRRWGPNARTLAALRKHLRSLKIDCTHLPCLGGVEVDLPQLYQAVEAQGGITQVMERGRWAKVAELLGVPSVPGVNARLDAMYVKYILPYAALSDADRRQLLAQVDEEYQKREMQRREGRDEPNKSDTDLEEEESSGDSDEDTDECISKDKSITLSAFYRTACHVYSALCPNEAKTNSTTLLEKMYWQYVEGGHRHISVLGGSIDTGLTGDYGFPATKVDKHPWNLKVLSSGQQSLLRAMGPLMGVTLPTLHLNMLFSTCCWYRDPHGLPWIEYLHTGADKVWYGASAEQATAFRNALQKLTPDLIREKRVWLPSDTVMVPPHILKQEGVNVCRTVQEPGQFIVVWPRAFVSAMGTGYSVSESVYFAPLDWLDSAQHLFQEAKLSCEPTVFSLDRLVMSLAQDTRANSKIISKIKPLLTDLMAQECKGRQALKKLGIARWEKVSWAKNKVTKGRKLSVGANPELEEEWECDTCRKNLFLSRVVDPDDTSYCLEHGILVVRKAGTTAARKFVVNYSYSEEELQDLQQTAAFAKNNRKDL